MLKKISVCIGTRPEAIKMVPVIKELRKYPQAEVSICLTGQHREMVDQVLDIFAISADIDFNLMRPGQSHTHLMNALFDRFDNYFSEFKPDLVPVQGDTTTVLAATMSAYYKKIPVGHIEAGLRTGNIYLPWPEEGHRKMVAAITKYHFAPTELNKNNLLREGVSEADIYVTGNTVIDSLRIVNEEFLENEHVKLDLPKDILRIAERKFVLITGHRRENLEGGLEEVCSAILELSRIYQDVYFVFPVHLNPKVREQVRSILDLSVQKNILIIEPLAYKEFLWLVKESFFILTDSGGIQEEAPSFGKPVLVTRDVTERPEGVAAGTVKLVGTKKEDIIRECSMLFTDEFLYQKFSRISNPYGDGYAAERIVKICLQ